MKNLLKNYEATTFFALGLLLLPLSSVALPQNNCLISANWLACPGQEIEINPVETPRLAINLEQCVEFQKLAGSDYWPGKTKSVEVAASFEGNVLPLYSAKFSCAASSKKKKRK